MSLHYFAFHLLPTVYCLLPAAYCLLPTAYCLLLTAYRLLPTVHHGWNSAQRDGASPTEVMGRYTKS